MKIKSLMAGASEVFIYPVSPGVVGRPYAVLNFKDHQTEHPTPTFGVSVQGGTRFGERKTRGGRDEEGESSKAKNDTESGCILVLVVQFQVRNPVLFLAFFLFLKGSYVHRIMWCFFYEPHR